METGALQAAFDRSLRERPDLHVEEGRGDQPALIYRHELRQDVHLPRIARQGRQFCGGLARLGVAKGDRVIVYMPMIPEAAVAMLACSRLPIQETLSPLLPSSREGTGWGTKLIANNS